MLLAAVRSLDHDEVTNLPGEGWLLAAIGLSLFGGAAVGSPPPLTLPAIPSHLHGEVGGLFLELLKSSVCATSHDELDGHGAAFRLGRHSSVLSAVCELSAPLSPMKRFPRLQ